MGWQFVDAASENQWAFADHTLSPVGAIRCPTVSGYLDDMDGDGRIELLALCPQFSVGTFRSAAVRLGPGGNELLGVAIPAQVPGRRWPDSWVAWQDENADGLVEFVLLSVPAPGATTSTQPWHVETVAVFEWTAPGGVLRPRYLRENLGVTFWAPPDGRPVFFSSDESLDSVIDRVLAESAPPSTEPSSPPSP